MSTRFTSGSSSHRAKQAVVQLLFGRQQKTKRPSPTSTTHLANNRRLDHSVYSYTQLKHAYLERVHELHPDKQQQLNPRSKEAAKTEFVELKEAWNRYEELAKSIRRVERGDETDSNFTMFGVGCSFSDNEKERELRCQIMDQACRGWFSAGELGDGDSTKTDENKEQRSSLNDQDRGNKLESKSNNRSGRLFTPLFETNVEQEEQPKQYTKHLVGPLVRHARVGK